MGEAFHRSEEGEIGLVVPQRIALAEPFVTQSGARLPDVEISYETYGALNEARSNAILVCHALSGGAHAAGRHSPDDRKPGWWDLYIGPGKALDTDRFFLICINVLASPYGTTGPNSINPTTGRRYDGDFPVITVGDWAILQRTVLERMGIDRLHGVVGGSTGGMTAFYWAVAWPDWVDRACVIAAAPAASAMVIALNHIQRQALPNDLATARKLAHVSYLSEEALALKFGRERNENGEFQVESYLEHKGRTFVDRFDPYCYLWITQAMDAFDLAEEFGGGHLETALKRVRSRMRFISFTSDWLFPSQPHEACARMLTDLGKQADHVCIDSPWGHDSFLVERVKPHLKPAIKAFMEAD